jgi:hypothetical protein
MKNTLILFVLLSMNLYSQKQYVSIVADIRNGTIGSDATIKTPALDLIILGGVSDKHGITIEVGYENFKAIEFSKMYFGLGYTFIHWSKKLECVVTIEPTYITRDWKGERGKMTYSTLGSSIRGIYNINDSFGVSLLGNVLIRQDNAYRYNISPPKVFSVYLGLTYTFKRSY